MKKILLLNLFFISFFISSCSSDLSLPAGKSVFIAFWNVENYFDTQDDPAIDDSEFLPESEKKWNKEKFDLKTANLAKVIASMNGGTGPEVLGFAEVENKGVLETLTASLKEKYGQEYEIVHKDSPDGRGIDVALIYKKGLIDFVRYEAHRVELNDKYPTRDVMQVVLKAGGRDLNLFINHWPSRRGGQHESEKNRIAAAGTLRTAVDKLFEARKAANVIIMGDFNDEPVNVSIAQTLDAKAFNCSEKNSVAENGVLYNLAFKKKSEGIGSYLYRSEWNMLDQIIVSGSLINGTTSVFPCDSFVVYKPDFIIQKEGNYAGSSLPTFGGKRYFGGYSDHFAVYAVFILK